MSFRPRARRVPVVLAGLLALGTVSPAVTVAAPTAPVIDLLVLYTPEVLKARGGEAQVKAAVETGASAMNGALVRSGIAGSVRVVGVEQTSVPQAQTGRAGAGITWLKKNAGGLRDSYRADLVSLVVTGGEGMASNPSLPVTAASSSQAWSVVGNDWLEPDLKRGEAGVFAHELGHNLGAMHDWGTNPGAGGANPERHGFADSTGRVDIMAYNTSSLCKPSRCSRQPYYSNPDITVGGKPFGQRGGDRPSDIASVFAKTMPVVAGYR
ncbi:M12 family metallo-peptidase [Tsukamurella strandjordii]|uniref:M12 family metallo-peptidase n=1 Tax=Tsukamurella strandjordii TaxID=147577 RepID=UPI0031DDC146